MRVARAVRTPRQSQASGLNMGLGLGAQIAAVRVILADGRLQGSVYTHGLHHLARKPKDAYEEKCQHRQQKRHGNGYDYLHSMGSKVI
ncbi:hypothetical protein GCM10028821_47260 [Hymenobacter jeollabukensis]